MRTQIIPRVCTEQEHALTSILTQHSDCCFGNDDTVRAEAERPVRTMFQEYQPDDGDWIPGQQTADASAHSLVYI